MIKSNAIVFTYALTLIGCVGDDTSSNPPDPRGDVGQEFSTTRVYQGAGSSWKATFNPDGSCSLEESQDRITVNCRHKLLSSGYREMIVSSVNGSNSISVNDAIYAIELEKYAFIMSSLGTSDGLIPLIYSNCPAEDVKSNYIYIYTDMNALPPSAFPFNEEKWTLFGTYAFSDISGNTDASTIKNIVTTSYNTRGSANAPDLNVGITCEQGIARTQSGNEKVVDYYLNKIGLSIVREGKDDGSSGARMFGVPQDTSGFKVSSLPSAYIGFMGEAKVDETGRSQNEKIVSMSKSNSEFLVKEIDPSDGSEGGSIAKINIGVDIPNFQGAKKATITMSDESADGACVFDTNANNKTFITCTAFHPITNNGVISFIFASK